MTANHFIFSVIGRIRNRFRIQNAGIWFGGSILTFTSLLLLPLQLTAQQESRHWLFGDHLHFEIGDGVFTRLPDSEMLSWEGSASISDSAGNLLFYTNGIEVYNRLHQPLAHSGSLNSYLSCAQSSIFIKKNDFEYYLVTNNGVKGLYYSVIDLRLNGGLGDISLVNQKLWCGVNESLTACYHRNGKDTWLITHEGDGNKFIGFLFTDHGVTEIVESPVGPEISSFHFAANIGLAKVSPNGTWLAVSNSKDGRLDLYCFNNQSGMICHHRALIEREISPNFYGIEFSPSSKRLYVGKIDVLTDSIYQFDLTKGVDSIKYTRTLVAVTNKNEGGMQLAADGAIYLFGKEYLGRIRYPEELAAGIEFTDTFFALGSPQYTYCSGLPNFHTGLFGTPDSSGPVSCDCNYVQERDIFIPNVITPNGDGLNETLSFSSNCYPFKYFSLHIWNRYGQKVFESKDPEQEFDGRSYYGSVLPAGVYYILVDYQLITGEAKRYKGTVTIIR